MDRTFLWIIVVLICFSIWISNLYSLGEKALQAQTLKTSKGKIGAVRVCKAKLIEVDGGWVVVDDKTNEFIDFITNEPIEVYD